ncbi:hypothetical protein [Pseudomonas guariconensis]|uniref:hypothetical protein n=1 Tax=Pseudomonas guariconensis TaxID=1288410 RepID=UPI0018AC5127|nr:hypothetical protein [Pseudomonas guariconensis]MBF8720480.1 hypothetical protein [Pseudomonas guariconensis]
MDTNKMREQFETAFVEEQVRACGEGFRSSAVYMVKQNMATVSAAWWAWQASRAVIVLDLSDLSQCFSPNDCGDWAMWLDDVKKLIEAQGLKVKVKP